MTSTLICFQKVATLPKVTILRVTDAAVDRCPDEHMINHNISNDELRKSLIFKKKCCKVGP